MNEAQLRADVRSWLAEHYSPQRPRKEWLELVIDTGYAVPTYVIDAPGGGGKIPLLPNSIIGRDGDDILLRNFEGQTFRYPDPLPKTTPLRSLSVHSDAFAFAVRDCATQGSNFPVAGSYRISAA